MTDIQWEAFSDQAITVAGVVYFLALLSYLVEWASLREVPKSEVATEGRIAFFGRLGLLLTVLAGAAQLAALVGRGMAADPNRVPWGNMYEFAISGTWFMVVIYLVTYRRFKLAWMAPLLLTFVLAVLFIAMVWLHSPVAPLTEALESYWLVIHVVSAVIATAAFSIGGLLIIMSLIQARTEKRDAASGNERTTGYLARVPNSATLDRISYRMHAFGFPVWTFAVLITGPIWAHEAWSTYWNWDPKEVWAFITWVVYAAYLHARTTAGLKGKFASVVALIGLATLWWSFIGVNFLSSTSQHSYAEGAAVVQVVPLESESSDSMS